MKRKEVNKKRDVKREDIKKEFDRFADKIAELEALRQELDSLDSRGFEADVKVIRAKLKNVDAIHDIRKEIDSLRERMRHKTLVRSRWGMITKKILEKSEDLEEGYKNMKKKIDNLEKELSRRKKVSVKKQLSKEEIVDVKEIPKLQDELESLKKDFVKHTGSSKIKIDSGVGVLVDAKFDDFINSIKGELTERIKAKELSINVQLKGDLEKREKLFAEHYRELIKEFHEKYEEKVKKELGKEVQSRFNEKLDKKLDEEKKRIIEELIKENIRKLAIERKSALLKLEDSYNSKERKLEERISEREKKVRGEFKVKKEELSKRITDIDRKKDEIEKLEGREKEMIVRKENELKEREKELEKEINLKKKELERETSAERNYFDKEMDTKRRKLNKELSIKRRELNKELGAKRVELNKEINKMKKEEGRAVKEIRKKGMEELIRKKDKNNVAFKGKVESLKKRMHDELKVERERLKKKTEEIVKKMIEEREREMRAELEKEYKDKLNEEIARKKSELEKHVVEQAKRLLG